MHESLIAEIYLYVDNLVTNDASTEKDFNKAAKDFKKNLLNLYKGWGYKCVICGINSLKAEEFYRSYIVLFTDREVAENHRFKKFKFIEKLIPKGNKLPCSLNIMVK